MPTNQQIFAIAKQQVEKNEKTKMPKNYLKL